MRAAVAIIVMIGLSACSAPSEQSAAAAEGTAVATAKKAPDWFYESEAKDRVREKLRAPDSAKFEGIIVRQTGEVTAVCGYVNSQNGFGGMSGRQRFISNGGEVTVFDGPVDPSEFARLWNHLCGV